MNVEAFTGRSHDSIFPVGRLLVVLAMLLEHRERARSSLPRGSPGGTCCAEDVLQSHCGHGVLRGKAQAAGAEKPSASSAKGRAGAGGHGNHGDVFASICD